MNRLRQWVGLIFPVFADPTDFQTWSRRTWWMVHLFFVADLVLILYFVNQQPWFQPYLHSYVPALLKPIYLPVVFALVYLLSWLGYLIWVTVSGGDRVEHPDIQAAWTEAMIDLQAAGYDIREQRVYLVLGHPNEGDEALFMAHGGKIDLRVPDDPDAPLRIYVGSEGIFVCCSVASTWGMYASALANPDAVPPEFDLKSMSNVTLTPGQALRGVDDSVQDEFYRLLQIQNERSLTEAEKTRLLELGEQIQQLKNRAARQGRLTQYQLTVGPERLAYLCRLLKAARGCECPLHGVLVVIPWGALETDDATNSATNILWTDLATIRTTLPSRYPHFAVVANLEELSGFAEFRQLFPKDRLRQRAGLRLPLVPDCTTAELATLMAQAADWMGHHVLAAWVVKFLRYESPINRVLPEAVPPRNRRLFTCQYELWIRTPRLGRLLARGFPVESIDADEEPVARSPLLGGCYLAATGRDPDRQAFTPGIFHRLTDEQNPATWTPEALDDDRRANRAAAFLTLATLSLIIGYAIVGYVLVKDQFTP